ncbi:methylation site containing protein [Anopheles sinensis]|uniref:Methylation site containing protein n=1 Tax=Anopheles sinensis TaxID=74873 RepID=A0A084VXB6_ANOSI|nr:methylation site containing protein [Anopheles sinensis]
MGKSSGQLDVISFGWPQDLSPPFRVTGEMWMIYGYIFKRKKLKPPTLGRRSGKFE